MRSEGQVVGQLIHVERVDDDIVIDALATGESDDWPVDCLVTMILRVEDGEGERLRVALDSVARDQVCWLRSARQDDGTHVLLAGEGEDCVRLAIRAA